MSVSQVEQPCNLVEYRHYEAERTRLLLLELLIRVQELCRMAHARIFGTEGKDRAQRSL